MASVGQLLHMDGGDGYLCSDETILNIFWDIETKLKLIENQLSKAFKYDASVN